MFADIRKAGVETEPCLFKVVRRREMVRRTDDPRKTHAYSRIVERSAQQ